MKHRDTMINATDIAAELQQLLPLAIAWAQAEESRGLTAGKALAQWQAADARDVGVRHIDRVRLCLVDTLPTPSDPRLVIVAESSGLLLSGALGLTLGHTVFIRRTHAGQRRLLRHELRHVAQHEVAGSVEGFLTEYLEQVVRHGYANAPQEIDARRFETLTLAGAPAPASRFSTPMRCMA